MATAIALSKNSWGDRAIMLPGVGGAGLVVGVGVRGVNSACNSQIAQKGDKN